MPEEPKKEPEQQAVAPAPPKEPPDKYANVPAEEREYAVAYDQQVDGLTPVQRYRLLELARLGAETLKKQSTPETDDDQEPAEPTKGKAKAKEPADDPTAKRLEKLEATLNQLQSERQREQRERDNARLEAKFVADIKTVLDGDQQLTDDERDHLETAVFGRLIKHRRDKPASAPFDAAAIAKAELKRFRELSSRAAERSKQDWLEAKVAAAEETVGETGSGGSPRTPVKELSADEFEKGYLGRLLRGA